VASAVHIGRAVEVARTGGVGRVRENEAGSTGF
jgi:hypothetical protein